MQTDGDPIILTTRELLFIELYAFVMGGMLGALLAIVVIRYPILAQALAHAVSGV